MSAFADAVALLAREDAVFADLLTTLYESRYTGTVVLHFAHGVPRSVDFPTKQIRLDAPPATSVLDTPAKFAHS